MNLTDITVKTSGDVPQSQLDLMMWINRFSIILMTFLMSTSLFYTVYDIFIEKRKKINQSKGLLFFSLYTTGRKLFNLKRDGKEVIGCLEGLRALSILHIVYFHSYFFRLLTTHSDENLLREFLRTRFAEFVSGMHMHVDTFFVISALLTTKAVLKDFELKRYNYF
ncbi:CLUMA_CG002180, isoform A, partial [Clunio marinus]